jgi:hypothetical protein
VAVTVAALPLLVLDNLPASAERAESTTGAPLRVEEPSTTEAPTSSTTLVLPTGDALLAAAPAPTTTSTTATPAPPTTAAPRIVSVRSTPTTQAPTTTVAPAPTPAPSGAKGDPNDPASWDAMAQCESGGNWSINTGNGYYGGLQFSLGTWQNYGGTGYPHEASKATQIAIGKRLQAAKGWGAWPGCARKLGFT